MSSKSAQGIGALFQSAVATGALSESALTAIDVRDIGAEINQTLGVSVDDIPSSEVTLVTQLVDDSSSIRFVQGNTEAVRAGHNLVIESLSATKQRNSIIVSGQLLNAGLLYPYVPIDRAARLDTGNYNPHGGTPLFVRSLVTLGGVIAKSQEFQDNGVACRTITAIVTDGGDNDRLIGADRVKKIVDDMLRAESHIVAGIGIDDGQTDFREVFQAMGIRPEWILTPKNTPSEIRRAFGTFSQSAIRVSQTPATFDQQAMGGFGG